MQKLNNLFVANSTVNMKLDVRDAEILNILQRNGRLSFRQISEMTGLSVPTISSRVYDLEKSGVIRGYAADLVPESMGEFSAIAEIIVKPSDTDSVCEILSTNPIIRQIFRLSNGKILLLCTFSGVSSMNSFSIFISSLTEIISCDLATITDILKEECRAIVLQEHEDLEINRKTILQ